MAQRYLFPGFDFNGGLPGAREARDKALEQVAEHSGPWMAEAMRHMRLMPDMWEGTGEEFRLEMLRRGLVEPHHWNAWGALIREAMKHELLLKVGMGQMKTKKSHARMTPVWRRVSKDYWEEV